MKLIGRSRGDETLTWLWFLMAISEPNRGNWFETPHVVSYEE